MNLIIRKTSPYSENASVLIDLLNEYLNELYPSESNHLDSREELSKDGCYFVSAILDNKTVGIGVCKLKKNYAEIKRVFVRPENRGSGIADLIMASLEGYAARSGIQDFKLETGIYQKAAINFYKNIGYSNIENFGNYQKDPLSRFMGKKIDYRKCKAPQDQNMYVVVFKSELKNYAANYVSFSKEMEDLAIKQDGLIGVYSHRDAQGKGLTPRFQDS